MEIKYDTPIEVTKKQYERLMEQFAGAVAGREWEGKYFIKVWLMQYAYAIRRAMGQKERGMQFEFRTIQRKIK